MTENEKKSIYGLNFLKEKLYNGIYADRLDCIDYAIAALEEIQQYREIGTVEECREAVEKQNPMEIKVIEDMCFECPSCKELVAHDDEWNTYNYCPNCGCRLKKREG